MPQIAETLDSFKNRHQKEKKRRLEKPQLRLVFSYHKAHFGQSPRSRSRRALADRNASLPVSDKDKRYEQALSDEKLDRNLEQAREIEGVCFEVKGKVRIATGIDQDPNVLGTFSPQSRLITINKSAIDREMGKSVAVHELVHAKVHNKGCVVCLRTWIKDEVMTQLAAQCLFNCQPLFYQPQIQYARSTWLGKIMKKTKKSEQELARLYFDKPKKMHKIIEDAEKQERES